MGKPLPGTLAADSNDVACLAWIISGREDERYLDRNETTPGSFPRHLAQMQNAHWRRHESHHFLGCHTYLSVDVISLSAGIVHLEQTGKNEYLSPTDSVFMARLLWPIFNKFVFFESAKADWLLIVDLRAEFLYIGIFSRAKPLDALKDWLFANLAPVKEIASGAGRIPANDAHEPIFSFSTSDRRKIEDLVFEM
jgi:hypothetical protein